MGGSPSLSAFQLRFPQLGSIVRAGGNGHRSSSHTSVGSPERGAKTMSSAHQSGKSSTDPGQEIPSCSQADTGLAAQA